MCVMKRNDFVPFFFLLILSSTMMKCQNSVFAKVNYVVQSTNYSSNKCRQPKSSPRHFIHCFINAISKAVVVASLFMVFIEKMEHTVRQQFPARIQFFKRKRDKSRPTAKKKE